MKIWNKNVYGMNKNISDTRGDFKVGCHLSFAGGYAKMGRDALSIGANAMQYFSRNPRGGKSKPFDAEDAGKLLETAEKHRFAPFMVHAPYTYNPCSANEDLRRFARDAMSEDLQLQAKIGRSFYNFHPGSHVGQGIEKGVELITEFLDAVLPYAGDTVVLLETMSGKGSEVGSSFGEIAKIIRAVKNPEKLGVCLDTCHVYSAGYDIINDLDGVLKEFDAVIGLSRLKAVHLNDSAEPFASKKDRHAKIGGGFIGLDAVARIVNHSKLRGLPFYLETPNELEGYAGEIKLLRSIRKGD